jgi:methyl-accepting chemotaxis protein/ligand-binding sensor domain-containing protein
MKILIGFLLFVSAGLTQTNNLKFTHITTDEGLSQSNVKCIIQDHLGFLWFGTFDGLNKFDGYNFTIYKPDQNDSTTIKSNSVSCLLEDENGNLWIGTDQGLCFYNRDKDNFRSFLDKNYPAALINSEIGGIAEDKNKNIWIATSKGIVLYNHSTKTFNQVINDYSKAVYADSRGNIWLGTLSKGLIRISPDYNTFTSFPLSISGELSSSYEIRTIKEDKNGILWVGTYGLGLAYADLNNLSKNQLYSFSNYQQNGQGLSSKLILSLLLDDSGIWVGTENGGINFLPEGKKSFIYYKNNSNDPSSLNNNSIYSILKDNAGDLWFGTFSGGINYLNKGNQALKCYRNIPGNDNSLSYNTVRDFAQDKDGNIWVATDGGGLNYCGSNFNNFTHYKTSNTNLNKDAILAVFIDRKDNIWVGAWDGGISLFDKNTRSFKSFTKDNSSLQCNNVFDIDEDASGNLWLGTTDGLIRFNPQDHTSRMFTNSNSSLAENHIEVLAVDKEGNILAGTTQGLSVFNPVSEKTSFTYLSDPKSPKGLSTGFVTAIFEDSEFIWVGTADGLNRIDKKTNTITKYYEKNGLPNNSIKGIEKDGSGNIWISTNKGISRFNPSTDKFKNYTKFDGLQGNEYVSNSCFKTRDGKLLFGGTNGFNYFDPGEVKDNTFIPPVVITDFQIFNKLVKPGLENSPLEIDISKTKKIDLSYTQNVFSFQFTALNFRATGKNEYAYILEGFDKDWNYIGTKRTASYTNLDPGEYVFAVKGSNNDGIWNDNAASIIIIISPPFWATWWFRTFILIVLALTVYWLINRAIKKRKSLEEINKKLETEIKLNKETEAENLRLAAEAREKDEEAKRLLQEQHTYLQNGFDLLLSHMNRFSEGDLSVIIKMESDDSFARLFAGFNKAVENFRKIILNLLKAIQLTAEASSQINSSTKKIADGTAEQSSRSEEVVSAVEQMTNNLNSSSKNSEVAARESIKATQIAVEGGEIVAKTIQGMEEINNVVNNIAGTIKKLEESSNEIGEIVELIDEIADQTNLLALNASIEAARAGEYGRGFAVVADEVQKLSERTAAATKNIAEMIKQIQIDSVGAIKSITLGLDKVGKGRKYAEQAGVSLENIIKSITEVSQIIEQVAAANEEQSAGVQHINESILLINDVSRNNASGVKQVTKAIEGLKNLTEDLQKIINKFNIESEEIINNGS